jgi:polysaccharide biosynthesis protein PslH
MNRDDLHVLVLSARLPFPPRWGFATRVYHLTRQLAARHQVTLVTYAGSADAENVERLRQEFGVETVTRDHPTRLAKRANQLRSLASRVPYDSRATYSKEMQRVLDGVAAARRVDVVQLESTLLSLYRLPPEALVIVDEHNVDYEYYERMRENERSPLRRAYYRLEELRFQRFEQRCWRDVDGCVMTSEREAEIVRAAAPETPAIGVPNGVDIDYFRPSDEPLEPRTIVFNGTLDYRPNLDGAEFLVRQVLPRLRERYPDVRVVLVGRGSQSDLDSFRGLGVEVTGEVPDVRPYLARAAVVTVPIRTGSGTRLKVVEGLAMGRGMVSTTLGCEGVDVRDGEHLLIADSSEDFAAGVMRLFEEPQLAAELGRAGREKMVREYSWAYAGELLESFYQHVLAARSPHSEGAPASPAPVGARPSEPSASEGTSPCPAGTTSSTSASTGSASRSASSSRMRSATGSTPTRSRASSPRSSTTTRYGSRSTTEMLPMWRSRCQSCSAAGCRRRSS